MNGNKNRNMIEDSILNEVSGGIGEKADKVCCPYCSQPNYLKRTGKEQVFFDGNLYYEFHCESCDINFWSKDTKK
jgi:hypothetical protein